MSASHTTPSASYSPPRLRPLGTVHELTQGGLGVTGDGFLLRPAVNGS